MYRISMNVFFEEVFFRKSLAYIVFQFLWDDRYSASTRSGTTCRSKDVHGSKDVDQSTYTHTYLYEFICYFFNKWLGYALT